MNREHASSAAMDPTLTGMDVLRLEPDGADDPTLAISEAVLMDDIDPDRAVTDPSVNPIEQIDALSPYNAPISPAPTEQSFAWDADTQELSAVPVAETTSVVASDSNDAMQPAAHERSQSSLWRGTKVVGRVALTAVTTTAAALSQVTDLSIHGPVATGGFNVKRQTYRFTADYIRDRSVEAVRTWNAQPWSKQKAAAPIVGSLAWLNLVFGESFALIGQGAVERAHATGPVSYLAHIAIAAAIEVGATYPIAKKNDRLRAAGAEGFEPTTGEDVVEAMGTAFWLGGAMGVQDEKLGRKHMAAPIASYLGFAGFLAAGGNVAKFASRVIGSPVFYGALVTAGLVKRVNETMGYEDGLFETLASKTKSLISWVSRRWRKVQYSQ